MCVCMYVCMDVWMCVYMYVCMYVLCVSNNKSISRHNYGTKPIYRNSRNESLPQSMELGEGTNQAGS